jgi:hypothetical protein
MAKITIYVPDDLKAEMDAAEGQQPNWSSVAQEAFQLECRRIANRKKGLGKMSQVIERLRKSKYQFSNQEKIAGYAAGREWSMERASFAELERIASLELVSDDLPFDTAPYLVLKYITGAKPEKVDLEEFWERWANRKDPSEDFVLAFVDGARNVYDEVADKL